jgi:diguanylate cyclase (GGDEF)-like protein/PAS domain S-box-containing protein
MTTLYSPDKFPLVDVPLLEALIDPAALVDSSGCIIRANESMIQQSGLTRDQLIGHSAYEFIPEWARMTQEEVSNQDLTMLHPSGHQMTVSISVSPITVAEQEFFVVIIRDNSAHRATEEALIEVERRFRLAFEDNMSPMLFIDTQDHATDVNAAFCAMIGRRPEEVIGHDSEFFTHPSDVGITKEAYRRLSSGVSTQERYHKRYLHSDGHIVTAEVSRFAALDAAGEVSYYVVSERDVTEERRLLDRLAFQALHDPLTKLANRALFDDRIKSALARAARQNVRGAVLLLDLDDFKDVNDIHGHLVGDELLVQVATRFEQTARISDTLCRFGGDEFLYLAENISDVDEAEQVAHRLLRSLDEPFTVTGISLVVRVSIGVVLWGPTDHDQVAIVRAADDALLEAKRQGKGHHVVASTRSPLRTAAISA